MIVWIFLATLSILGGPILTIDEKQLKYGFSSKEICEEMIKDTVLKCYPIKIVK